MNDLLDKNEVLSKIEKGRMLAHSKWREMVNSKKIKEYFEKCAYYDGYFDGWYDAETEVSEIPVVNHWISCAERLPENEEQVIAVIDGSAREAIFDNEAFIGSNFWRSFKDVSYWMSMPEIPDGVKSSE